MKKKLFIAAFVLALCLPFPLYALCYSSLDTENYENRTLTSWQDVTDAPFEQKPGVFEDFLNDHAAFRNQFMTLNASINYHVFGTVQSSDVLLGKNEWLFYKNVSDSKSLDDYQGLNLYTDEQLAQIAENLTALESALAEKGIEFAVLIAPNKEGVYSENMPSDIPAAQGATKAEALVQYLKANTDVTVVYPKQVLIEGKALAPAYYKQDTHWNSYGAFLATQELALALDWDTSLFEGCEPVISDEEPVRDLANISATYHVLQPDVSYQMEGFAQGLSVETWESDLVQTEFTSTSESGGPSLLMLRDSFGGAMLEYLAAVTGESRIVHLNAFTQQEFSDWQPDVFVFEIAERSTDRFLDYLPRLIEWAQG